MSNTSNADNDSECSADILGERDQIQQPPSSSISSQTPKNYSAVGPADLSSSADQEKHILIIALVQRNGDLMGTGLLNTLGLSIQKSLMLCSAFIVVTMVILMRTHL